MSVLSNRRSIHRVAMCTALVVFFASQAFAAPVQVVELTPEEVRLELEQVAAEMTYLPLGVPICDRPETFYSWGATEENAARHRSAYQRLIDKPMGTKALEQQLKHPNAKVRTLALVVLYDHNDAKVLPAIAALRDDAERTFDGHANSLPRDSAILGSVGLPELEQTVGMFAKRMVDEYVGSSEKTFENYWKRRGARDNCAGWFRVKLMRAAQFNYTLPKDRIDRIKAIRQGIEQLPADYATFVLLYLCSECSRWALLTDAELVERCAALEHEKLMLLLERKIPTDDPDLLPSPGKSLTDWESQEFILKHAKQLLTAKDVPRMRACPGAVKSSPLWTITMAELDKPNATQILREGLPNIENPYPGSDKIKIVVALWRLGGDAENDFICDWFFNTIPYNKEYPSSRLLFLRGVMEADEARVRALLAKIVADERFDRVDTHKVDVYSLDAITKYANRWVQQPIGNRKVRPLKDDWLAHDRQRLRESLPEWSPKK